MIWRFTHPSIGGAVGVALVSVGGASIGLRSLADNSFMTHLATGRIILASGSVPVSDPYTFTAAGEPWVVQSWLASLLYASVERIGGLGGVRLLMGLVAAVLIGLVWHLLRPAGGLLARLLVGALMVTVGAGLWTERPYMLGLIAFGLVVLAAEGRLNPMWLAPLGWLWANTHGSYPLGMVYLLVAAVGTRLDGETPAVELRCLRWLVPGLLLGAVGPLGPGVLLFPFTLLSSQDLLSHVIEWQAPRFVSLHDRAFLLQVLLAIVLLVRRPRYRSALITAVFTVTALTASRNLAVASLALAPSMALGLAGLGGINSEDRTWAARLTSLGGVALAGMVVLVRLAQPTMDFAAMPVDALAYLERNEIDLSEHRMAAPDIVGNFLEFVYGPGRRVFSDDRYDMFPAEASEAAISFFQVSPDVLSRLETYDIELAAIPRSSPLALVVTADARWRILFQDDNWLLACRRGVSLAGSVDTC
ncbi:MAG: hypothetical protein EXQ71_06715 [Acidimicrobiia bacterium]|nr:hypothetical protein [Acidimicrobiia bacterium]